MTSENDGDGDADRDSTQGEVGPGGDADDPSTSTDLSAGTDRAGTGTGNDSVPASSPDSDALPVGGDERAGQAGDGGTRSDDSRSDPSPESVAEPDARASSWARSVESGATEDLEWFFDPSDDPGFRFRDVVGLDEQKRRLRETLMQSVASSGSRAGERSVLLHGDTGVGKRRLAKALVGELCEAGYRYEYVETIDREVPEDADRPGHVRDIVAAAGEYEPLVLVLDCFDEHHRTGSAYQFREQLSLFRETDRAVYVVAIVDNDHVFNEMMQAYFRAFDLRLEVQRPDRDRRRRLLEDEVERLQAAGQARFGDVDLTQVAVATDGLYVNDVREVVRRATQRARAAASGTDDGGSSGASVAQSDLLAAAERIETEQLDHAAAREMLNDIDVSAVDFDDVGGLEGAKRQLRRLLEQPLEHADAYEAFDIPTNGGVLLHGPPGNGKTLLAKAVANVTGRTFISVAGPELVNPLGAGTEGRLRSIFEKARRNAPSVVFIDEFDSVGVQRGAFEGQKDETTNTLLTELDGLHANDDVVVVAATNRLETLDPALLRPGRFEHLVEVAPPDASAQREVFAIHTADLPLAAEVTLDWLVDTTDDLSGAAIAALCNRAARLAIDRCDADGPDDVRVTRADFERALERAAEAHQHRERTRTRDDRMYR